MTINPENVEDIVYLAKDGQESLLIKVRGNGWLISSGGNPEPGLTPERCAAWIAEDGESFEPVIVQLFQPDKSHQES